MYGAKCTRPEKKVSPSRGQNCFCCATNTHVCHPEHSPSCTFSITGWLELRDDGWGQGGGSFHTQACVSRTCSPAAINLVLRPLKPASSNATALQTKGEIRSRSRRRSRTGNQREKRKTSCSRWHQMYLRGSSRGSPERALPRYERLQTGSEWAPGRGLSAKGGWANAQGRQGRIASSSSWFSLIYVTTLKTLGTNKITEDHFGSKSKTHYLLQWFRCQMAKKHLVKQKWCEATQTWRSNRFAIRKCISIVCHQRCGVMRSSGDHRDFRASCEAPCSSLQ